MLTKTTRLLLFLLLLFSENNVESQILHESTFNGKPRFIMEESFEGKIVDGAYVKIGKDRQISWMNDNKMEFDRNGNLVKRSFYNDQREFIHAEEYQFSGNRLHKKYYQSFVYSYVYDINGNVIEEKVAPITDTLSKKLKFKYAYNSQNQLTEAWEYDFQGGHVCHQTNTYNTKALLVKELYKYSDGLEYKTFSYDNNDQLIKIEWFDASLGLLERTSYTYSEGYLKSEFWEGIEKNKVESSMRIEYDKYGNALSVLDLNPKRQINDHEVNNYLFDQQGNWIKKTTAVNNVRFYIVERIIAYY